MKTKRILAIFFLIFFFTQYYPKVVKVNRYVDGYVVVENEDNRVFLEFVDKSKKTYRKNFVFYGKAYSSNVFGDKIFIAGSSLKKGALYVADVTGIVSFKYFDNLERILSVIPDRKGLFIVGKQPAGYAIILTDFYGHIEWERLIVEKSCFIKAIVKKYLYIIFESAVYKVDLNGNILYRKYFRGIASAVVKNDSLYVILNHNDYSFTQYGRIFVQDTVKDACVFGDDIYSIGNSGIWKNYTLLLKGQFKGINCTGNHIIIWTDETFFELCRGE